MQIAARMGNATSFRANRPLTDDEIRRVAPSVFAADKHESRSERYTYIPTIDVLNGLKKEGFEVYSVSQGRSRVPGKAEYTKHMLKLRHANEVALREVGQEINEIVLINSHDGTSSYQMASGVFRVKCMNGLVVCERDIEDVRIKHSGNVIHDVIEGAHKVLDGFGLVRDITEEMKSRRLLMDHKIAFAEAALELKYDGEDAPIMPTQLLRERRIDDRSDDLWTTFNVIQENVIRGGISGRTADNRRTRTREVTAIDTDMKLNRALWKLTQRMNELLK